MGSRVAPLCPTQDPSHPSVWCLRAVYNLSLLVHQQIPWGSDRPSWHRRTVPNKPSFYLIMSPKWESNGVGNLNMPERSHEALPLNFKIKVLDPIKKNPVLRLLRSTVRTNLLSVNFWRKKKKFVLTLLSYLKLQSYSHTPWETLS